MNKEAFPVFIVCIFWVPIALVTVTMELVHIDKLDDQKLSESWGPGKKFGMWNVLFYNQFLL